MCKGCIFDVAADADVGRDNAPGDSDENDKLARHDTRPPLGEECVISSGQGGAEDKLDRQQHPTQLHSSGVVNRTNCPVQPTSLIMNTYTCILKTHVIALYASLSFKKYLASVKGRYLHGHFYETY